MSRAFKENILFTTRENVGKDFSLGFELTLTYNVFSWWRFSLIGNYFNYRIEGSLDGVDLSNENNSWTSRFSNTFKVYKQVKIQVNSRYDGPIVDLQGRLKGYYSLNLAAKSGFFDNTLNVSLEFRDLFSTIKEGYKGEGPGFITDFNYQNNAPLVIFSVSYRFDDN